MDDSKESIKSLLEQYGSPLHVFDEAGFIENYRHLNDAMASRYSNYRVAYSYKTNYTPYICSVAKGLGAYAEVVSGMEYDLAKKIGYDDRYIIFNGPEKGKEGIRAFLNGCMVNADSLEEVKTYLSLVKTRPEESFKIGLRVNLDIGQGFVSRFGMNELELTQAFQIVSEADNLEVAGLHCHISRCRGVEAWRKRTEYMLELADRFFVGSPEYIDLGSGMFGSMAPSLASQFDIVPTYEEYAEVTTGIVSDHYKRQNGPILFTEPGTTLVNRFVQCIMQVQSVKKVNGHYFAVLDGSIHNLGETATLKKLPVRVISGGCTQVEYESIDLTGYTCLEQDILLSAYKGKLAPGDYVIFENTGGYSVVLKPPFIRPACAMVAEQPDSKYRLIKKAETYEDVFHTFVF